MWKTTGQISWILHRLIARHEGNGWKTYSLKKIKSHIIKVLKHGINYSIVSRKVHLAKKL